MADGQVPPELEALLRETYAAFNARAIHCSNERVSSGKPPST